MPSPAGDGPAPCLAHLEGSGQAQLGSLRRAPHCAVQKGGERLAEATSEPWWVPLTRRTILRGHAVILEALRPASPAGHGPTGKRHPPATPAGLSKLLPPREKSLMLRREGKNRTSQRVQCWRGSLRADALLVQPRVSEGIQELRVPPGMHFSPLPCQETFQIEMLEKTVQ